MRAREAVGVSLYRQFFQLFSLRVNYWIFSQLLLLIHYQIVLKLRVITGNVRVSVYAPNQAAAYGLQAADLFLSNKYV
jgi:hypothetical protein